MQCMIKSLLLVFLSIQASVAEEQLLLQFDTVRIDRTQDAKQKPQLVNRIEVLAIPGQRFHGAATFHKEIIKVTGQTITADDGYRIKVRHVQTDAGSEDSTTTETTVRVRVGKSIVLSSLQSTSGKPPADRTDQVVLRLQEYPSPREKTDTGMHQRKIGD